MWETLLLLFGGIIALAGRPATASCTKDTIVMSPPRVVVRYGDSVSVTCSKSLAGVGMGWEATHGGTKLEMGVNLVTWAVAALTVWTISPLCYVTFSDDQCSERLPVTVYKMPDSVSLLSSPAESSPPAWSSPPGPMVEGRRYQLRCAILSVAPVHTLTVTWVQGGRVLRVESNYTQSWTPMDVSPSLSFAPRREDDGAQILCRTQLDLGPAGPHPLPVMSSEPHRLTVHYPPTFTSPEEETLDVVVGEDVTLNCTASGNPAPVYSLGSDTLDRVGVQALHTAQLPPGTYSCTASNSVGNSTKTFIISEATRSHSTFWAVVGVFVGLALVLVAGYMVLKFRAGGGSDF